MPSYLSVVFSGEAFPGRRLSFVGLGSLIGNRLLGMGILLYAG